MFHPAVHQHELLAGDVVVLSADCETCRATLVMEWALPNAAELRARVQVATELPIAAGAEPHGLPASPAPVVQAAPPRLGNWRIAEAQAERAPAEPTPPAPEDDPRMVEFLNQFTERIDRARNNLSRVHEELPQAIIGDGDTLRRPMLARRPSIDEVPRELTSTPVAFAAEAPAIQQPSFAAQPAPAPEPTLPAQPVAAPEPITPVAAPVMIETAFAAGPAVAPEPVAETEPVLAPEPAVAPDHAFAALALDAPIPAAVAHAVTEHGVTAPALGIAPTDADVFPPAAVQQPVAAGGPALADAAADVWAAAAEPATVTPAPPTAPHTPFAAALSASAAAAPPAPAPMPGPMPSALSFAAPAAAAMPAPAPAPAAPAPAFAPSFAPPAPETAVQPAVEQPTTPMGAAQMPVDMPAPAMPAALDAPVVMPDPEPVPGHASPEHGGAAAEAAFEPQRGFDWGPDAESPSEPKRRGRMARRARTQTQEDALSLPGVSSFAVSADVAAELDAAPRRTKLGSIEIFAIVVLAAIAGLAGVKVATSDTPQVAASSTPVVTQPAAITPPISDATPKAPPTPTTPAAKAAAKARAAKAAKAKAAAAKAKTGTPVASSIDANAASMPVATDATPTTQVQTAPADTAAMTAADAPASNPAARP